MGIKDVSLDGYNQGNDSENNNYSSLDRGILTNAENCSQDDGYNCGVFTLLVMMMRHKGDMGHLQRHYTSDNLTECCLRFFNLINDIFKAIIPNNKFFYAWEKYGVKNNPRKRRYVFLDSLLPGYGYDKRWELMRKISVPITRPEGKLLSNEDYDNNHRIKLITFGK